MPTRTDAIEAYIRAKDENRPFLMSQAFDEDATLYMVVNSDAISFPPETHGREAITEVLVREFGKTYENVRTLCLSSPPSNGSSEFSCQWLVGMSSKSGGLVRVGCGRYDWAFRSRGTPLAKSLMITIDVMQMLAPTKLVAVTDWLFSVPYPWCPLETAFGAAPTLDELVPLRRWAGLNA
jgi:hypothetical protein